MAQPTKGEEGYKTPVQQYPDQENQQDSNTIRAGAIEHDQLESFNENASETGGEEANAGHTPTQSD